MNHVLEQMMTDVGGLLERVQTYDRNRTYREEIAKMERSYEKLKRGGNAGEPDRAVLEQLAGMKVRLLTMFENLLFIA